VRMQGGAGACFLLSLQPTGTECAPGKGIVRSNAEWNDYGETESTGNFEVNHRKGERG